MSMFCYQCQEAAKGTGCTVMGMCGKDETVSNLQDLLIYAAKGVAIFSHEANKYKDFNEESGKYLMEALFMTITNANFDPIVITDKIKEGLKLRSKLKNIVYDLGYSPSLASHDAANWSAETEAEFTAKAETVGILATENEDVRSLRELLIYGLKGMAAYANHAYVLNYKDDSIFKFIEEALVATLNDKLDGGQLTALVLECGKFGVAVMDLLDKANTGKFGHPELTKVNIGVGQRPGILISGHDLHDMEALLQQTEGTGVDVYTHSEMLPAHYYPAFKKYSHFVGNYGNAWWKQAAEFESFNGPILMTTNCIVPPKASYINRIYTTGSAGFTGVKHITANEAGQKDFSEIVEQAKSCAAPKEIEKGEILGGFAHNQVMQLAGPVVEAVKSGAIRKFVVMAGCDGRQSSRNYYTDFAKELGNDTVILTAGCAKYRYNKLQLGDINGIPRVLDAGQCNDSYSLAVIALKLKEVFQLNDINDLPIAYNIAWYEQKAVIVLLALLHLGVKNINLGPTLPAFLSPNVAKVLIDTFGIGGITDVKSDLKRMVEQVEA